MKIFSSTKCVCVFVYMRKRERVCVCVCLCVGRCFRVPKLSPTEYLKDLRNQHTSRREDSETRADGPPRYKRRRRFRPVPFVAENLCTVGGVGCRQVKPVITKVSVPCPRRICKNLYLRSLREYRGGLVPTSLRRCFLTQTVQSHPEV